MKFFVQININKKHIFNLTSLTRNFSNSKACFCHFCCQVEISLTVSVLPVVMVTSTSHSSEVSTRKDCSSKRNWMDLWDIIGHKTHFNLCYKFLSCRVRNARCSHPWRLSMCCSYNPSHPPTPIPKLRDKNNIWKFTWFQAGLTGLLWKGK